MPTQILHDANQFHQQVARLRELAPDFPHVYFENYAGCMWATTMVIFTHLDVKYKRHHVESIVPTDQVNINHLHQRLITQAQLTIAMGRPFKGDIQASVHDTGRIAMYEIKDGSRVQVISSGETGTVVRIDEKGVYIQLDTFDYSEYIDKTHHYRLESLRLIQAEKQ